MDFGPTTPSVDGIQKYPSTRSFIRVKAFTLKNLYKTHTRTHAYLQVREQNDIIVN